MVVDAGVNSAGAAVLAAAQQGLSGKANTMDGAIGSMGLQDGGTTDGGFPATYTLAKDSQFPATDNVCDLDDYFCSLDCGSVQEIARAKEDAMRCVYEEMACNPPRWDIRVTGFRFNASVFLHQAGVIKSEAEEDTNATANTAENGENGAGDSEQTTNENTSSSAVGFDTPLLTAITQKIGNAILAQNPDWEKVAETSNEYLNQQFMIQPRLLRGQTVELSERFEGLCRGPCGILSKLTRKQIASNAVIAEVFNRLLRNVPEALLRSEFDQQTLREQGAKNPTSSPLQEKIVKLSREKIEATKEWSKAKQELKEAEEEDPYDTDGSIKRLRRVEDWKKGSLDSIVTELEIARNQLAKEESAKSGLGGMGMFGNRSNAGSRSGSNAASPVESGAEGGRNNDNSSFAARMRNPPKTLKAPFSANLSFVDQFPLFQKLTEDEETAVLTTTSKRFNRKGASVMLTPGGAQIDSIHDFVDLLMQGSTNTGRQGSSYSFSQSVAGGMHGGSRRGLDSAHNNISGNNSSNSNVGSMLPKHQCEVSFSKQVASRNPGIMLSYLKNPGRGGRRGDLGSDLITEDDEDPSGRGERGKEYVCLVDPAHCDFGVDPLRGNHNGGFMGDDDTDNSIDSADSITPALEVPNHFIAIKSSGGPLAFEVAIRHDGVFYGADCSGKFYNTRHEAVETSDLLWREEALTLLRHLEPAAHACYFAMDRNPNTSRNQPNFNLPEDDPTNDIRLPLIALLQGAAFNDVKIWPCANTTYGDGNNSNSKPVWTKPLMGLILSKMSRDMRGNISEYKDSVLLLLKEAIKRLPIDPLDKSVGDGEFSGIGTGAIGGGISGSNSNDNSNSSSTVGSVGFGSVEGGYRSYVDRLKRMQLSLTGRSAGSAKVVEDSSGNTNGQSAVGSVGNAIRSHVGGMGSRTSSKQRSSNSDTNEVQGKGRWQISGEGNRGRRSWVQPIGGDDLKILIDDWEKFLEDGYLDGNV